MNTLCAACHQVNSVSSPSQAVQTSVIRLASLNAVSVFSLIIVCDWDSCLAVSRASQGREPELFATVHIMSFRRECACACVRACVRACVCVCVCNLGSHLRTKTNPRQTDLNHIWLPQ